MPARTVDQWSPVPLNEQLAGILREEIQAGVYDDMGMLPSEATLQEIHGVSRGTVRLALARLQADGLVYKAPARGTFITRPGG